MAKGLPTFVQFICVKNEFTPASMPECGPVMLASGGRVLTE
jgi:hypothetical protein